MSENQKKIESIFENLWKDYTALNPNVMKIRALIQSQAGEVVNDHVAFRTFGVDGLRIDDLAQHFVALGYTHGADYQFEKKKLKAKHFDAPSERLPKVFISELILEECSSELQEVVRAVIGQVDPAIFSTPDFLWQGRPWAPISFQVYDRLRQESEYAAWTYVFGFRANHFTVSLNHLEDLGDLESMNSFLKTNGFSLNSAGGEIKGGPSVYLSQSSTLADKVSIDFVEGSYSVPSCFYEFALRHKLPSGQFFQGFVADNADKIFESTNAG